MKVPVNIRLSPVHLDTSQDTSKFSCECLALWWLEHGQQDYTGEDEVLVVCDGGGSNSSLSYLFNEDLEALSNRLGLKIRIAHYPPYCSKFNPIEAAGGGQRFFKQNNFPSILKLSPILLRQLIAS